MLGYLRGFDDIFDQVERMNRDMEGLFGNRPAWSGIRSVAPGTFPPINVGSSAEQVDLFAFAPGLDPATIEVEMQQNLLTIAGERKVELPEDKQLYRNERFSGRFRRVLTLPEDVDPDQVSASYKDGVLHITVKRSEVAKPRRIEIH
ncbi:MAG: Hsp20/alpha crystallin family protein [Gammaproteobacteria bacterium]|nr:Hsp20/alpha crystallin family protein [Gammaproteobacteria bacterium]